MKIPGMDSEKFTLLTPYTRNDPPIMSGWLAAGNDGEDYGSLTALLFPKDRQVDSTRQVEARIDNDLSHTDDNVIVACLKCNLQRRRQNKDKFRRLGVRHCIGQDL